MKLKEFTFKDQTGADLCRVRFRLDGKSLQRRGKAFKRNFKAVVAPLALLDINADGTATTAQGQRILDRAEVELKQRLNILLGTEDADALFVRCRPFASVGGKFFCILVLEGIAREMERAATSA